MLNSTVTIRLRLNCQGKCCRDFDSIPARLNRFTIDMYDIKKPSNENEDETPEEILDDIEGGFAV
jgi:hypothetical protein